MRRILYPIMFFACFGTAVAGGPWTQPKGQAYTSFNVNHMNYQSVFGPTGAFIQLPRTISEIGIGAYVEYGVTDRLTAILDLPFDRKLTISNPALNVIFFQSRCPPLSEARARFATGRDPHVIRLD